MSYATLTLFDVRVRRDSFFAPWVDCDPQSQGVPRELCAPLTRESAIAAPSEARCQVNRHWPTTCTGNCSACDECYRRYLGNGSALPRRLQPHHIADQSLMNSCRECCVELMFNNNQTNVCGGCTAVESEVVDDIRDHVTSASASSTTAGPRDVVGISAMQQGFPYARDCGMDDTDGCTLGFDTESVRSIGPWTREKLGDPVGQTCSATSMWSCSCATCHDVVCNTSQQLWDYIRARHDEAITRRRTIDRGELPWRARAHSSPLLNMLR